ncbi:hypothetical protein [Corynebacterium lujinxingii]|uniref:Uncharacterized protein n=1 Tax=Corynebacterium lujinxingii TaxID=2763010 RepID=A0A7H0K0U7_9CORY|nr:hypothetical protein [Corynebacterium lujinxingii]MBC3179759.1 hypothetical protein [Corynebacterium lujinxingii]NNO10703.1 hypothetical protein [Corynebacterium lujinxingii]QNP90913.1 hypothetical protein IAU68_03875 [Corynebacterium lujinxingii]
MNSEMLSALVTLIVGVVGAALTYAGIKATNKAQAEAAEPANWQTLTTEMKAFFKEQLAERDQRLAALEAENGLRTEYIAHLETIPEFTDPPFPSFHKWRAGR